MWARVKEQLYQCFIVLDQGLNVFPFMGSADETLSSRCFRMNHIKAYKFFETIINAAYKPFQGPDHCMHAYEKEVLGRQYPKDFYDRAIAMGIHFDPSKLGPDIEMPK